MARFMEGGSLFDHLHRDNMKISDDKLLEICEDIVLGMTYLHSRHILHCDLKSSNILVNKLMHISYQQPIDRF